MITLTAADIDGVRRVRARITPLKAWTQAAEARDADGNEVGPRSRKACRWCARGALKREVGRRAEVIGDHFVAAFGVSLINTNDEVGHSAVLVLMDRFIAAHETAVLA